MVTTGRLSERWHSRLGEDHPMYKQIQTQPSCDADCVLLVHINRIRAWPHVALDLILADRILR